MSHGKRSLYSRLTGRKQEDQVVDTRAVATEAGARLLSPEVRPTVHLWYAASGREAREQVSGKWRPVTEQETLT